MRGNIPEDVRRTIERVARESYGRLVAYLSSHTRDLACAEDALGNALVVALRTWPQHGVPESPEAWLLTAARHSLIDVVRHQRVASAAEQTVLLLQENAEGTTLSTTFLDERLKLLFVCAHPAALSALGDFSLDIPFYRTFLPPRRRTLDRVLPRSAEERRRREDSPMACRKT